MKRLFLILILVASSFPLWCQNNALQQKLVNALMYVDEQTIIESERVDDYIEKQFRLGNYSGVLRNAKTHLQNRRSMINQMYLSLSEQERAELSIMIEGNLIFHYILSASVHANSDEVMGDVYDYLLFMKQSQLRTSKQIAEAIKRSGNKDLLYIYSGHNDIRQQLAQSNPPRSQNRDSLQDLQNRSGRVLAHYGKQYLDQDAVTWRDIQKRLGNGEAAVEFVCFNLFKGEKITSLHQYAAVIVTQTCKQPKLVLMTSEKYLTYWNTDNPGDLYKANLYGSALGQWIWLEVLTYLARQDVTNIYFSPAGILNNMAIESLPFDKESPMSYHYNLTRLTSTRELVSKHNIYPRNNATLYGNLSYRLKPESNQYLASTRNAVSPLPWSKQEIDSINRILFSSKYAVSTLSQKQGTEASFKSLDGRSPSVLHIATHGFVNRKSTTDVMKQSGLIMSYGARAWEGLPVEPGTEDGLLTAAEIASLDLSGTDIVVLSACNTALGEITSEGVWGLQRAFKQAGVQTIVISLWQVDDEAAAVFMQYFYEALVKGRRTLAKAAAMDTDIAERIFDYPHDALRTAQDKMRKHPKYSDPYFWAAFIVII